MPSAYAARYRAARGYAGLSQDELAKKLGVSDQTVKRRESGKLDGTLGDRIAVATICGVPVEFMESGWGALEPSEIRALLSEQRALLHDIRTAVTEQKQVNTLAGDLVPEIQGVLETLRHQDTPVDPLPASQQTDA